MSAKREIEGFLRRYREALDKHGFTLWRRQKTGDFLVEADLNRQDVARIIKRLNARDYEWGPSDDDNPQRTDGEVWAFSTEFAGYQLFIKLKLGRSGKASAECISFHEAERPPRQPLRRPR